jgi:hypothetical protein
MKTRLAFVAAIAAVLLATSSAGADHSWGSYHWERSSNPVRLGIGDNMTSDWTSYLSTAVGDWNASPVLDLGIVDGAAKGRCNAKEGKIEVCNDSYGFNGWLGVATISVSGDHITSGSAKMNDSYFTHPTYDTPEWKQLVVCQEIGHLFGLGHQNEDFSTDETTSCMEYTSDPAGNEHPDSHDYDQLLTIYGHDDAPAGGDGGGDTGPPACRGKNKNCAGVSNGIAGSDLFDTPAEWGTLVSEDGRHAVYERDFGHGEKQITVVTWAH